MALSLLHLPDRPSGVVVMADAADVTLAGIWDLNEGGARVVPMEAPMARMSMSAAPTPVEPGNVSVSADVTIRFFIRPKR